MGRYTWQLLWLHGATAPVILGEQRLNFKWISSLFISGHPVDGENDGRDAGDVPGG
jgi:hypothetical protein